jgi:hypothetical protein
MLPQFCSDLVLSNILLSGYLDLAKFDDALPLCLSVSVLLKKYFKIHNLAGKIL